jgi:uncharacterized protein YodC (DUF2158 family)
MTTDKGTDTGMDACRWYEVDLRLRLIGSETV